MKYSIMLLSVLFLFSCGNQNKSEKELSLYELKGKVNHLTIYHYYPVEKDGKVEKGLRDTEGEMDQTITFNKHGYVIQAYFYGEADSLDTKVVRELDKNDHCIKEFRYDANKEMFSEWVWEYDDRGNNIKRSRYLNDGSLFTASFLYYDENNQIISRKDFRNSDNALFDSLVMIYDEKGRQIKEEKYGYYGHYSTTTLEYSGNEEMPESIYLYDNMDELNNIIQMKYNNYDLLEEARQFNADTLLVATVTLEYEYDSRGNWIKKIQFYDGDAISYQERRIIYY